MEEKNRRSSHVKDKMINEVVDLIMKRTHPREVNRYLKDHWGVTYHQYRNMISSQAKKRIKEWVVRNKHELVDVHIDRYESIYQELLELGQDDVAMDAMAEQETLLGWHREDMNLFLQNEIYQEEGNEEESKYNFNNLSLYEQKRVKDLLEKAEKKD